MRFRSFFNFSSSAYTLVPADIVFLVHEYTLIIVSEPGVYCPFRDGRMDCCPAQLYAVVVCLFVLLSGICALTGYTYYVHARLDAMHAICAKLELSMQPNPNSLRAK